MSIIYQPEVTSNLTIFDMKKTEIDSLKIIFDKLVASRHSS